eukprot:COSAG02_NODE_2579_length_8493_cov_28.456040_11_plen_68_part_00
MAAAVAAAVAAPSADGSSARADGFEWIDEHVQVRAPPYTLHTAAQRSAVWADHPDLCLAARAIARHR